MSDINVAVNKIVDRIYESGLKKNYLHGVTTLEELAAIDSELGRYAYSVISKLEGNSERLAALKILSRIEL